MISGDELLGKPVYKYFNIGERLNFDKSGYSFCHFFEVGIQKLNCKDSITPEKYYDAVVEKIYENFDEDAPCRHCSRCKEEIFEKRPVSFVTINTSGYCNSNCVYCSSHGILGEGYNPLDYLVEFHEKGAFKKDCLFDWGGGEPTLNPHFEKTVKWIYEHGYRQRINTNAILFSHETYNALLEGQCSVRISVDAGTEEVFRRVKGHEYYADVWKHIGKYCSVSDKVYIKYNIFHFNSEHIEADVFLDNCEKNCVKNIYVEAEHFSYGQIRNVGPLFFEEKELEFAKYLYKEGQKRGFHMLVADGFTDRQKNKTLEIPEKLVSNIDRESIKNGIICKTFATVNELIHAIDSREVLIWGAGNFGKLVYRRLQAAGQNIVAIIDSNEKIQGSESEIGKIISPVDAASRYKDAVVILATHGYADVIKVINEKNWAFWKENIYYLLIGKYC